MKTRNIDEIVDFNIDSVNVDKTSDGVRFAYNFSWDIKIDLHEPRNHGGVWVTCSDGTWRTLQIVPAPD